MSKFGKLGTILKVSALGCAVAAATLSSPVLAATFKVPVNYTVELVDGKKPDFGYNRFDRTVTLSEGRHQMVFLFEGSFGVARDSRLIQAANPIVVEIPNMPADANYTFTYNMPRNEGEAERFSRSQRIALIDANTKAPLSKEQASYYLLTSDSGFAILRDYREDLASVGRLYAPAPVLAEMNVPQNSYTAEGVETVQARSGRVAVDPIATTGVSATVATANAQNQAAAQAQASGAPAQVQSFSSPAAAATYNQMVQMYEAADDATKLQFVKYIMSH